MGDGRAEGRRGEVGAGVPGPIHRGDDLDLRGMIEESFAEGHACAGRTGRADIDEIGGKVLCGELFDDFVTNVMDNLFADIWSRPGLSVRDRRLVIIGVLAALGEGDTLGIQVRAALAAGGSCDGPPGLRREGYYAAFIRDPDGNRIEAVTFLGAGDDTA